MMDGTRAEAPESSVHFNELSKVLNHFGIKKNGTQIAPAKLQTETQSRFTIQDWWPISRLFSEGRLSAVPLAPIGLTAVMSPLRRNVLTHACPTQKETNRNSMRTVLTPAQIRKSVGFKSAIILSLSLPVSCPMLQLFISYKGTVATSRPGLPSGAASGSSSPL